MHSDKPRPPSIREPYVEHVEKRGDSRTGLRLDVIYAVPRHSQEHFRLDGATIHPLTGIGEVTARIFGFNESARLHEREEMIQFGKYG